MLEFAIRDVSAEIKPCSVERKCSDAQLCAGNVSHNPKVHHHTDGRLKSTDSQFHIISNIIIITNNSSMLL